MLKALDVLFRELDSAGIRYCHWKSNDRLEAALAGEGDLDLLLAPGDRHEFEAVLSRLGYRIGRRPHWSHTPDTAHFYGLDEASGSFIHLHVYFRMVTGGSILKNHWLPFGPLALENPEPGQPVPTPRKDIDLATFVIRKMIEFGSPIEAVMVFREGAGVRRELAWLAEGDNMNKAADLVAKVVPEIDRAFFLRCAEALLNGRSLVQKLRLGRSMSRRVSRFARIAPYRAAAARAHRLASRMAQKVFRNRHTSTLGDGGAIVAVVGPDATGKSTIGKELYRWLSAEFWTERVHAGRPPATWLTLVPQGVLPFLRRAAPTFRTSSIAMTSAEENGGGRAIPLKGLRLWAWVARALMIAHDRQALLRRIHRLRAKGAIIVCDRYPSIEPGAMDSAQLSARMSDAPSGALFRACARLERSMYEAMPAPAVVLRLTVPVELAIVRNRSREKPAKEGEAYLRLRHDQARRPLYRAAAEIEVDTSGSLSETVKAAKTLVWRHLSVQSHSGRRSASNV
jgi:thymidylate kinase